MNNSLKDKIITSINKNDTRLVDEIRSQLNNEQNAIVKQLNDITETNVREFLIDRYSKLHALNDALYRFKHLSINGLNNDAYKEAQNVNNILADLAENVTYRWVTEPNACERCRAMNGNIYYSAADIPDKPHPNCKCKIEINKQNTSNTFYLNANAYSDKTKPDLNEINKMKSEIDKLNSEAGKQIKQINELEKLVKEIERKVNLNAFPLQERNAFEKVKKMMINLKHDINKAQKENLDIQNNIKIIQSLYKQNLLNVNSFNIATYNLWKKIIMSKEFLDTLIHKFDKWLPLSAILWDLSSSKFKNISPAVKNNINIIYDIDDLPNKKLKNIISTKVKQQYNKKETRGIIFDENSIYSQEISESLAVKRFIKDNKHKFKPNFSLPDDSIIFGILNPDLFNSFHRSDIIDIYIDSNLSFNAKILDTYDFNKKDLNPLVILARNQQLKGNIENYYTIINIKIPMYKWILF